MPILEFIFHTKLHKASEKFFARLNEERWSMADYATAITRHIEDYEQNLRLLGRVDRLYLLFLSDHYTTQSF